VTWTDSLADDDTPNVKIVGMQVNAGAVDNGGNVYVVYPESPRPYPDYTGAAVKYVSAPADLSHWSTPVTVAPPGGAGHILTHLVAGDPGKLAFFYVTGVDQPGGQPPLWYPTSAETLDGLATAPAITEVRVAGVPMWKGDASLLMGVCNVFSAFGPTQMPPFDVLNPTLNAASNGFVCGRSSDVLGMALDSTCHFSDTWYASKDAAGDAAQGTYVSTQAAGPTLGTACSIAGLTPRASAAAGAPGFGGGNPGTPNTGGGPGTVKPLPILLWLTGLAAMALLSCRVSLRPLYV